MVRKKTMQVAAKVEGEVSVSPSGEQFPIPKPEDYAKEYRRLAKRVEAAREEGLVF